MTQLSETQSLILSAAAQRPERIALPLPDRRRGSPGARAHRLRGLHLGYPRRAVVRS